MVIDLKKANIWVRDGYSKTWNGAINNLKTGTLSGAHAAGATVLTLTGVTGIILTGSAVTFPDATDPNKTYRVTAHVETLGNTTSITITPGLVEARASTDDVNVNGFAAGATVLAVDGFIGAISTGANIQFTGHQTVYSVSAHTETLGNTTSITVTPALVSTILDNVTINETAHQILVKIGQGNCTYSEKKAREYILDRGKLDSVRDGDEAPVEVKLDFTWENITGGTGEPPTIEDALKRKGAASEWVSTGADPCEPYCVDIVIEHFPECTGVGASTEGEVVTLPEYRYEQLDHDPKAGTVSTTGKCNVVEASAVRIAA